MAEAIAIPAPRIAQFPKCIKEHKSFTCLTAKVLQIIERLPSHEQKQLSAFMQSVLYPGVPEEKVPVIPSSPKDLMRHVQQYCDPLNIDPLKQLGSYLKDPDLTTQLEKHQHTPSDHLKWDTQVDVVPPPAYKSMFVDMKTQGNTTVRKALEVRDFMAEHLMFKGNRGIFCLAGLANDSLVFYLSEGIIGPMLQRMQHNKDKMLAEGVELVTFVRLVQLDVASGVITLDQDVPRIDQAAECPEFGVLLIGETGSGKSTLINNLFGEENKAKEGNGFSSETATITQYRGTAAGVPVVLYDTPGMDDRTAACAKNLCKEIKKLIKSKKVCLTIFCFSMNGQRIKQSHISAMQAYNDATVNWDKAIVALTFADQIKAPRAERKSEGFNEAEYFQRRITDCKTALRETLVKDVRVPQSVVESLIIRPTTDEWDSKLPDDQEWFIPLWLDILDLLEPAAYFRLLEIHRENIKFAPEGRGNREMVIKGKNKDRLKMMTKKKLLALATTTTNAASATMCLGVIISATGMIGATAGGEIIFGLGSAVTKTVAAVKKIAREE